MRAGFNKKPAGVTPTPAGHHKTGARCFIPIPQRDHNQGNQNETGNQQKTRRRFHRRATQKRHITGRHAPQRINNQGNQNETGNQQKTRRRTLVPCMLQETNSA